MITKTLKRGALLFLTLCCVYLLTYSANLVSNDELMMMDVTGSLVQFGDFKYDLALWYQPTTVFDPDTPYPLTVSDIDRLQMMAAAPLFWLASRAPGVGLVHAVWLLNIIISALACLTFFQWARVRGYGSRTAVAGALLMGLTTVVWVYSKMFFREPLALLMLTITGLLLAYWQRALSMKRLGEAVAFLVGAGITTGLSLLAKDALLVVIPGLMVLALPGKWWDQRWLRWSAAAAITALVLLIILLAFTPLAESLAPGGQIGAYPLDATYTQSALHSYFFSIGGSLWASSPILLLALPGVFWRRRDPAPVLAALLMLLGVGLAYGLLREWAWFAGLSWPPRFLVPVLPFVMLLTLPVIDRFIKGSLPLWGRVGVFLLVLYSLWWQFTGLALPWTAYAAALPPESGGVADWLPGLNTVRYLRPVVVTQELLQGASLDFAWVRLNLPWWPLVLMVLTGTAGWLLSRKKLAPWWQIGALVGVLVVFTVAALLSLYRDPRYQGGRDSLHDMLAILEEESAPGDVVVLSDTTYHEFFLNYAKLPETRFVTLPIHPGERGSFEQPLQVVSEVPDELLARSSPAQLRALAAVQDRLWLLMETSPFLPWSIRPVERFMSLRYYPIRQINTDPPDAAVRLLEYDTTTAPEFFSDVPPDTDTAFVFDETLALSGYTLPEGATYAPGAALPVSLRWRAETAPEASITIAFFLANGGRVVQGEDGAPAGGFYPTDAWEGGQVVWDNRALRLPDDLPAGEYALWLRLYTRTAEGELRLLPVEGGTVQEGTIAVLPTMITVVGGDDE
ncbi:MAG: hypothetical protein OHK0046_35180 [Anaerolineae bacterium]